MHPGQLHVLLDQAEQDVGGLLVPDVAEREGELITDARVGVGGAGLQLLPERVGKTAGRDDPFRQADAVLPDRGIRIGEGVQIGAGAATATSNSSGASMKRA